MSTRTRQLHVFFFPFMAHGHMIPTIDLAKLFASRGCKTSIILTHVNSSLFAESIEKSINLGFEIQTLLLRFPATEVGLPEGCENSRFVTTQDIMYKFFAATLLLREQLEQLLMKHSPDCLVADLLFPWATEAAAKFAIPRLIFHGTNFFAQCVAASLWDNEPHKKLLSDSEPFTVPNLPHEIKLTRDQTPIHFKEDSDFARKVFESELTCYGVVMNSYYELEPDYADHYRGFLGRKAWHVGPVSLVSSEKEEKTHRGPKSCITDYECLNWLDSKEPKSVVYVSFGTIANFDDAQLMEIANGLEAAGKHFIWVVKKEEGVREEWLAEGFEERVQGKGLIIRGWAPQVVILEHQATGGFVTHCGWNSTFEGICAGLPMVTWPVAAEQFFNEKFVTDILGIGVSVGAAKWARFAGDGVIVKSEAVEKAVRKIMEGDKAEEMRRKATTLSETARLAFEEGGSSYSDLNGLIEELRSTSNTD